MRIVETLVLKLDELWHHDIVGETLLDAVQVLFHGCVRCRHLDHLDIVSQRRQLGQGFIDPLHELRGETRLHVLEFTFKLFEAVAGL